MLAGNIADLLRLRRGGRPEEDKGRDIRDAGFVVIDTELTGLDKKKDSIISIGAVRMKGGRIDLSGHFYRLVNPETDITAESVVIHEIVPSEVSEKPAIGHVLGEFLDFCGKDIIIGYCVDLDMEFLNRDAKRLFGATIRNGVLDVLPVFEWMRNREAWREGGGMDLPAECRLYDIAKHFGIAVNGAHNAIIDAFITAQVFQRVIPVLVASGISTAGDLMRFVKSLKGGDRRNFAGGMSNF
jgi:DNA polymerase-3 subunit epsilon